MCGILVRIAAEPSDCFEAALETLRDRGPDERGVWQEGGTQLGHRRLSIIDLTTGRQPMHTPDGRFHVVYNGEIYNFRELRDELIARGVRFHTASDTEVLLAGFRHWGAGVLDRLDGIFAFAVWDSRQRELFLARDRFGVKPLVYAPTSTGFVAASTLKPLFQLDDVPRRLNLAALKDYFAAEYIPAPATILRDVQTLPPAHFAVYRAEDRRLTIEPYWEICRPVDDAPSDEALVDRAADALEQSVRRQLISDVPLGAFLSGGIDSSLVTAAMTHHASGRVRTFSMSFRGLCAATDESGFARQVADKLGTEHHELDAREIGGDEMLAMVERLDQPLADPAYLPTLMLSQRCREHITVALSGDGGDELFGGYGKYAKDHAYYAARASRLWPRLRAAVERGLLPGRLLSATLTGNERVFWNNFLFGDYPVSRRSLRDVFSPDVYRELHRVETMAGWKARANAFSAAWDTDTLMRCDLWSYLSDNCLVKTDRAGMAASLEIRVPLLGNPVVDHILPLDARVKFRHGGKWILKHLCRRFDLPDCVWNRPKHGFSVPLEDYFQGPWKQAAEDLVHSSAALAPFLNAAFLRRTWARVLHKRRRARFLWAVLVLLAWLRAHRVSA